MNNFAFNPPQGFKDSAAYPNPNGEAETREQLMSLHEQTRDFINANLTDAVTSDTVVKIKANATGFSYSTDGTNYTVIEGSGSGQGDMYTSVYDTDANGIVDNAEKVNNHTVETDVPANAVFTDTIYDDTAISDRLTEVETHLGEYTLLGGPYDARNTSAQITVTGLDELVLIFMGKTTAEFVHIFTIPARLLSFFANSNRYIFAGTVRGSADGNYIRYHLNTALTDNDTKLSISFGAWINGSGYSAGNVYIYGR